MKLVEPRRLRLAIRWAVTSMACIRRSPAQRCPSFSHSAGVVRDGPDSGQFVDRRPFLSPTELRADLEKAPILKPNARFKYSNHGYGLLGLAIEAVTGEPYTLVAAARDHRCGGARRNARRRASAEEHAARPRP